LIAKISAGALCAILTLALPVLASAEEIHTFWRLEPTEAAPPTAVELRKPALKQRLLPIGLVTLTEPLKVGKRSYEVGSQFFKVFNDDGKIGYCPAPPLKRMADSLVDMRIPILDQKPCLVDTDKDGRFDAVFSAFEQAGGLPAFRGPRPSASDPRMSTVSPMTLMSVSPSTRIGLNAFPPARRSHATSSRPIWPSPPP
jgi:hypothetical protein